MKVICTNYFQKIHEIDMKAMPINDIVAVSPINTTIPYIVMVNGVPVFRKYWSISCSETDIVVIYNILQGGGDTKGKDTLRMVAQLALIVMAFNIPGTLLKSELLANIAKASVIIGGSYAVNSFLPLPSVPVNQAEAMKPPSPTYNVSAQNNIGRIGQPIPCLYGTHIIYPDLASKPYTEYNNNVQYLYMLLCLGHGEIDVEQINIDDTPIENFTDLEWKVYPPNTPVTQYSENVVTSIEVAGQVLFAPNESEHDWVGPFSTTQAEQYCTSIAIDIVFPMGLYEYNTSTGEMYSKTVKLIVDIRPIDNNGDPQIDYWIKLSSINIVGQSNSAIRKTFSYPVTEGRYQIRVKRITDKIEDSYSQDECHWESLKSFLPGVQYYGNVTMMTMRARATNTLNSQTMQKINCIGSRKLNVYNGLDWDFVKTKDIAPVVCDILANDTYGAGSNSYDNIDLDGLLELSSIWAERGDYFSALFDQKTTVWDALSSVLRCGRARPLPVFDRIYFIRDQEQLFRKGMYIPSNIISGSVSIQYSFPGVDTPDGVRISFMNQDFWKEDTVDCSWDNHALSNPAKIKLFGCTNKEQAWREGMYILACQTYNRKTIKFKTELDALNQTIGDRISIAHDLPGWDDYGEVIEKYPEDNTILLEPPFEGNSKLLFFRTNDGGVHGPYAAEKIPDTNGLVSINCNFNYICTNGNREKTYFIAADTHDFVITGIRPLGNYTVEVSAVNYDERVYVADTGDMPINEEPPLIPASPTVGYLRLEISDGTMVIQYILSWGELENVDYYIVEGQYNQVSSTWFKIYEGNETTIDVFGIVVSPYMHYRAAAIIDGEQCPWTYNYSAAISN